MKAIGFVSGIALGMAAAVAAVSAQHDEQALIPPAQAVTNQHF